jgi:hypothetical protein
MASKGKKKTTMAKLARESRLRERQHDKAAKKDARKRGLLLQPEDADALGEDGEAVDAQTDGDEVVLAASVQPLDD